jgi:hypothetical protein
MAFATRRQIYDVSDDLLRAFHYLEYVEKFIRDTCANEGLPLNEELQGFIKQANDHARQAYGAMVDWNDNTRISNELYMNSDGPAGGERERLARTDVDLSVYETWRQYSEELLEFVRAIEDSVRDEFVALRLAPAAPAAAADRGPPMGGSGKPHKSRGDEWHSGQNRRYI